MVKQLRNGDLKPLAERHEPDKHKPERAVNAVAESGVKFPEVNAESEVLIKLDNLLVETEGRGTIYYLAFGLKAKQSLAKLKRLHPDKKQAERFQSYITGLGLSTGRSVRSIYRYMEIVDEMTDEGTLTGVIADALKTANFTQEIQEEVIKVTNGMGFTDLCIKYGKLKKKAKPPTATTVQQQVEGLIGQLKSLMKKAKGDGTIPTAIDDEAFMKGFTTKLRELFHIDATEDAEKAA